MGGPTALKGIAQGRARNERRPGFVSHHLASSKGAKGRAVGMTKQRLPRFQNEVLGMRVFGETPFRGGGEDRRNEVLFHIDAK
jgi:hypothetical protein